jgi:hypothetical protein
MVALTASEDDFREHAREIRAWHERRRRRHEVRMAALDAFGGQSRRQRQRVEVPAPERLRVAHPTTNDTGSAQEAEEEAAEADRRDVGRRRR